MTKTTAPRRRPRKKRRKLTLKEEIQALLTIITGVLILYGMLRAGTGPAQPAFFRTLRTVTFGPWFGFVFPVLFILYGVLVLRRYRSFHIWTLLLKSVLLTGALCGIGYLFMARTTTAFTASAGRAAWGWAGFAAGGPVYATLGFIPGLLILPAAALILAMLLFRFTLREAIDFTKRVTGPLFRILRRGWESLRPRLKRLFKRPPRRETGRTGAQPDRVVTSGKTLRAAGPKTSRKPVLTLLAGEKAAPGNRDVRVPDRKRRLAAALDEFGIRGEIIGSETGPGLVRYEFRPARGVKLARITPLEKDLSMKLAAGNVRIIAPLPGRGTVGIEVPRENPDTVRLRPLLASPLFRRGGSPLSAALGMTVTGKPYVLDLADAPHLLIAGTTGSGKSVCLHSLLVSWLFGSMPQELQFLLIDPKHVELAPYAGLPADRLWEGRPVVSSPKEALTALEDLADEMDSRYRLFRETGVRSLADYNRTSRKKLPFIVCIVDEYGDLMTGSKKAVEEPLGSLARMARGAGIHLVLATQRPSAKVVTGVIKANFPVRIAFRVLSGTDSRTVLDRKGAEQLAGKGDMLLLPPGESDPVRLQGALVESAEVDKLIGFIAGR